MYVCNCSHFNNNFGSGGATISLLFFSGSFNNVTFSNHSGPVVRVSNRIILIDNEITMPIITYIQVYDFYGHALSSYMYSSCTTQTQAMYYVTGMPIA